MKKGESVKCLVDYDLFDFNIKDEEGCCISFNESTEKYLIWFPCNDEWAELKRDQFERINKKVYISSKYKEFTSRVEKLKYSA